MYAVHVRSSSADEDKGKANSARGTLRPALASIKGRELNSDAHFFVSDCTDRKVHHHRRQTR